MEERNGTVKHFVSKQAAHRRLGWSKLCSGFEPTDNREPPVTHVARTVLPARRIGNTLRVGKRKPNIVIAARSDSGESLFTYADNREWHTVQFDRTADYLTRAPKGALPVTIIEHGDRRCGRFVVLRFEQPAGRGLKTHRAEEVPRNELAVDNGRRAVPRQIQPARVCKGSRLPKNIRLRYFAKQRFRERA